LNRPASRAQSDPFAGLSQPWRDEPRDFDVSTQPSTSIKISHDIGRYIILGQIGQGGMGTVYEAYDPDLARKLAIKVLRTDARPEGGHSVQANSRATLVSEAKNLAKLAHPNVVPIFDVGTLDDDGVFLAMEYVVGESLDHWLAKHPNQWQVALDYVLQAGEGLAAAHAAGILHRDFKPANLLVGNDGIVRVLDFGISEIHHETTHEERIDAVSSRSRRLSEADLANLKSLDTLGAASFSGTVAFLAPEIIVDSRADERADLFAFGCVLFEALTGKRPFPSDSFTARVAAVAAARFDWPREIPYSLRRIVEKTLSFEPSARGKSVRDVITEIRRRCRRRQRRLAAARVMAALALPIGLLVGWFGLERQESAGDPNCLGSDQVLAVLLPKADLQQAAAGFADTGLGHADELWQESRTFLDDWGQRWLRARHQLCPLVQEPRFGDELNAGQKEQSRACLEEGRQQVAAILQIWAKPTVKQVMDAKTALSSLSDPDACTKIEILRERRPLPIDPLERKRALKYGEKMETIRMRLEMADFERAQAELEEIRSDQESAFSLDFIADEKYYGAELEYLRSGMAASSAPALWNSMLWVTAVDHATRVSENASALWFARVYRANHVEEMEESLRRQEAATIRAGRPPKLESELDRNRAIAAAMGGNFRRSLDHLHSAIRNRQRDKNADALDIARLIDDLAVTSGFLNQFDKALEYQLRAQSMQADGLPAGHPERMRMYGEVASSLSALGRPVAASEELARGENECTSAQVPPQLCAPVLGRIPALLASLGRYSDAAGKVSRLITLEVEANRRFESFGMWAHSEAAYLLAARGELTSALDMANEGFALIESDIEVRPGSQFLAFNNLARIRLLHGDYSGVREILERMHEALLQPSEESGAMKMYYSRTLTDFTLASGNLDEAISMAQETIARCIEQRLPAQELAAVYLTFGRALLRRGHPQAAGDMIDQGLAHFDTVAGLADHLRVPYLEERARVHLAQRDIDNALADVERAYTLFDATEVLENRLAHLHALEASIRWEQASCADERKAARELAQRAKREYQDWDAGAQPYLYEVDRWLRAHRR
jgi:tetratricopeptide (TPR) repeat protein/predicted Ser/Thr protein kinase